MLFIVTVTITHDNDQIAKKNRLHQEYDNIVVNIVTKKNQSGLS